MVSVTSNATLMRGGSPPSALVVNQPVSATDDSRTGNNGQASLVLTGAGKAKVDILESTRLRLNERAVLAADESEDWLELEQGRMTLQVTRLARRLGMSVQFNDARVIAHDARFTVQVSPRAPSRTVNSVAVKEGRVEVASPGHVVFLGPSENWSPQIAAPAKTLSGRAVPVAETAEPTVAPPARTLPARRASSASESTLAQENRLYGRALCAAGGGDLPSAVADLGTMVQLYPRSPLAQNARVERFRLLQQNGNASGAAQARGYLSEYPNGFARDQAQILALIGLKVPE